MSKITILIAIATNVAIATPVMTRGLANIEKNASKKFEIKQEFNGSPTVKF